MLFLTLCVLFVAASAQVTNDCNDSPIYHSRLVPGYTELYKLDDSEERYLFVGHTVSGLLALRTLNDAEVGSETAVEFSFDFAQGDVRQVWDKDFQAVDLKEKLVAAFCQWGVYINDTDCGYDDGFDAALAATEIVHHALRPKFGSDESIFYTDASFLSVSVRIVDEEGNTVYPSQAKLLTLSEYYHFVWDDLTLFLAGAPTLKFTTGTIGDLVDYQVDCSTYPEDNDFSGYTENLYNTIFGSQAIFHDVDTNIDNEFRAFLNLNLGGRDIDDALTSFATLGVDDIWLPASASGERLSNIYRTNAPNFGDWDVVVGLPYDNIGEALGAFADFEEDSAYGTFYVGNREVHGFRVPVGSGITYDREVYSDGDLNALEDEAQYLFGYSYINDALQKSYTIDALYTYQQASDTGFQLLDPLGRAVDDAISNTLYPANPANFPTDTYAHFRYWYLTGSQGYDIETDFANQVCCHLLDKINDIRLPEQDFADQRSDFFHTFRSALYGTYDTAAEYQQFTDEYAAALVSAAQTAPACAELVREFQTTLRSDNAFARSVIRSEAGEHLHPRAFDYIVRSWYAALLNVNVGTFGGDADTYCGVHTADGLNKKRQNTDIESVTTAGAHTGLWNTFLSSYAAAVLAPSIEHNRNYPYVTGQPTFYADMWVRHEASPVQFPVHSLVLGLGYRASAPLASYQLEVLNSLEDHPTGFTVSNGTSTFEEFQEALVLLYTSTQTADLVSGRVEALEEYNLYSATSDYTLDSLVGGSGSNGVEVHRLVLAATIDPIHWHEIGLRPFDGAAFTFDDEYYTETITDSDIADLVSEAYNNDGGASSGNWVRASNDILTLDEEAYDSYVGEEFDNTRGVATAAIVIASTVLVQSMMTDGYLYYKQRKLEKK